MRFLGLWRRGEPAAVGSEVELVDPDVEMVDPDADLAARIIEIDPLGEQYVTFTDPHRTGAVGVIAFQVQGDGRMSVHVHPLTVGVTVSACTVDGVGRHGG